MTAEAPPQSTSALFAAFQARMLANPDGHEWDGLRPELAAYLRLTSSGTMLQHPLVYALVPIAEIANAMYETKSRELTDALRRKRYDEAIRLYEKPWRISTLLDWFEDGTIDEWWFVDLLPNVWRIVEFPASGIGKARLVRAFRRVGYLSDEDEDMRTGATRRAPTQPQTLYRGATVGYERGLSWTRDREVAVWFARRFAHVGRAGRGCVLTARISPRAVLAQFGGRGEAEVVVDTRYLRKFEREWIEEQP